MNANKRKNATLKGETTTGEKVGVSETAKLNDEERRDVERLLKLMICSHRPG